MADAAVSFAIENVGNFLIQEGKFLYGVKGQVEEMQTELKWMRCFLKEAEARKGESHSIRNWISEIREAAYDVEDLIEGFALRSVLRNQEGVANRIKKYASSPKHAVELHRVGSGIKAIKAKLSGLRERLQTYGVKDLGVGGNGAVATSSRRKRQDYLHVEDHNVVGLDQKTDELVQQLLDLEKGSVVCLYGMGGVGKTTTAKKVYSDHRIKAHFECFAWVYLSQQFNPRQVLESILSQLSGDKEKVRSMSEHELASELYGLQKKKMCLLVIDDIWRSEDWRELDAAFPYLEKDNKSKILLTTRTEGVASHEAYVYHTSLDLLNHTNSVDLLKNTILLRGGPTHPLNEDSYMNKYGVDMVKQCGGLPLAIIVLGGILATKHELIKWERVAANVKLVLKGGEQEGNDGVQSILKSSYEDLPYNLKSCFLYFSRYQEDEEIKTTELKQRWIGEGFVSSVKEGDETMEDIAEEYLDELVRRCMIQVGRRGHTGRVKTCRIHDLMRDLCVSKAREEGFAHSIKHGVENEGTNLNKVSFRRLCISSGNQKLDESVVSSLERTFPQLRSIWFEGKLNDDQCKKAVLIVKKLKLVRVLELPNTMWSLMGETKSGRKQIGNLIHLRFLKLGVSMLPTSIGNLICLQTLNLRSNINLIIPDSVWRMEKLRHLYLPKRGGVCGSVKQVVGDFKNLQTLVNFPPENFNLEQNLVKFINVRKLVIIKRSGDICNILQRSLGMVFNRLESLSIMAFSQNVDLEAVTRSCPSLYRLVVSGTIKFPEAPSCGIVIWPSNLTKLVFKYSRLGKSHMRSLGKLPRLKALFLYGEFRGEQMIFHENDFPQLHHLLVQRLESLQSWVVHEGGLPSLCCLEIVNCGRLESVPDGLQYLKQCKELKVTSMPYLFRKKLEKGGQYWERVRNVPSISFSHCYGEGNAYDSILDESSSLELLKKTILSSGGPDHPIRENSKMDMCAIEMAKICGGVRVAMTILGGILGRKHEIEEWESIKSVLKEVELKGNDIVTSLLELSYADLPCHLKPRFLLFSQYARDQEIKTSEIIQRWIGEGFVMEDVAELVSRCLIQEGKRSHRSSGKVTTCRIHEFVWHFCVSKAKEEGSALSLKLGVDLTFLKLGGSELSKSFGNLRCLQTLNLESCVKDCEIPDWVWGMEQLRHLYLPKRGSVCESRRQHVGDFSNLQTLVNFPPSNFDLQQNLVKFTNVRKLVIVTHWVGRGEMGRILRSQDIVFNRLQSLSLSCIDYIYVEEVDLEAFTRGSLLCLYRLVVHGPIEFPSCTAFWPPNLTKLVLRDAEIDESQLGSLAKLQSLQVLFLQFYSFLGKEMVFHTNDFPQLHHLMIDHLHHLETWAVHEGALSNLLCLEIVDCEKLKSVPDGSQYLKQLKQLKVRNMPCRFTCRLKRGGEDWDRVSHVPSISCA